MTHKTRYDEYNDKFKVALLQGLQLFIVYFLCYSWKHGGTSMVKVKTFKKVLYKQKQKIFLIQITI